jgi:hypothetical protein
MNLIDTSGEKLNSKYKLNAEYSEGDEEEHDNDHR